MTDQGVVTRRGDPESINLDLHYGASIWLMLPFIVLDVYLNSNNRPCIQVVLTSARLPWFPPMPVDTGQSDGQDYTNQTWENC